MNLTINFCGNLMDTDNFFKCDFQEFKKQCGRFFQLANNVKNKEELDNIFKTVTLFYLNFDSVDDNEIYQSSILIEMIGQKVFDIEFQLAFINEI